MSERSLHRIFAEWDRRTLLLSLYIFFIIAALLIVKPVRNSLFLTNLGAEYLPHAFILTAFVSAIFAVTYFYISKRVNFHRITFISLLFFSSCLVLFWFIFAHSNDLKWIGFIFYIWVAIFGVASASQFWLLANYVFDAREARKRFNVLGGAGIAGGIFGGYLAKLLAPFYGTANLLLFAAAFVFICILLSKSLWTWQVRKRYVSETTRRLKSKDATTNQNPLHLIFTSKHLKYVAVIVVLSVIVANLVDYQFNVTALETHKDTDNLTAFFGFWLSNLSLVSIFFQILLTGTIIRRFGVGTSLLTLPSLVVICAVVALLIPGLGAVVLVKVTEGSLKQSINKSSMELLILPVPSWLKNRTKITIDVFLDNLAAGATGILLLVLGLFLHLDCRLISIFIIILIIPWIVVLRLVQEEYLSTFRQAIDKRQIGIDSSDINLTELPLVQMIESAISRACS